MFDPTEAIEKLQAEINFDFLSTVIDSEWERFDEEEDEEII